MATLDARVMLCAQLCTPCLLATLREDLALAETQAIATLDAARPTAWSTLLQGIAQRCAVRYPQHYASPQACPLAVDDEAITTRTPGYPTS